MITKDSLSGLKKLRDNLSFEDNPDVSRANKAIGAANKEFIPVFGFLSGWTSGFDKETGEVMIFIPLENFTGFSDDEKNKFYEIVKEKFTEADFEIVKEEDIGGEIYFHVGFASHMYILQSRG